MDTIFLRAITLFSYFFRLGCFSYCSTNQLHKNLHKHNGGAKTDTEVETCQTHFISRVICWNNKILLFLFSHTGYCTGQVGNGGVRRNLVSLPFP